MSPPRIRPLAALVLAACLGAVSVPAGAAEPSTTALPQAAAPSQPSAGPRPATQDPRGMSDAERKAYPQSLREARDLVGSKRYDEAIARLDALIAAHPREPQARFIKGIALTDAGKTDEAIGQFRSLIAEFPELPEPRNNLAVLYAKKGEYALARDELERAVQAAPDYAIAHENLGDVYARLAQVEYDRVVALDRRNRSAPAKLKLIREAETAGK